MPLPVIIFSALTALALVLPPLMRLFKTSSDGR